MKPSYHLLKSCHYSSMEGRPSYKNIEEVYTEIGYDAAELVKQNHQYEHTCAIRMSLALLKAGMSFTGRLKIKDGELKGRYVEMGAMTLADELRKPHLFGKPSVFLNREKALKGIGNGKGVIFFHTIAGYGGGHIDLYEPVEICNSNCYFASAREIWFWLLN